MDKDFEKKVKQKRIRTIAVVLVVLAAVIYLIAGTKVEKADYTASLRSEIQTAQSLYDDNKDNVGNKKGQYTRDVMAQFAEDIEAAQAVLDDENSAYNDIKSAYETLQEQIDAFKKAANEKDLKTAKKQSEKKQAEDAEQTETEQSGETNAPVDSESTSDVEKEPAETPEKEPAKKPAEEQQTKPADDTITVSLTIRCDTLAADLSKLRDKALEAYVPADGMILSLSEVGVLPSTLSMSILPVSGSIPTASKHFFCNVIALLASSASTSSLS
jgi:FtsZ-interacting cell division protein ZipA